MYYAPYINQRPSCHTAFFLYPHQRLHQINMPNPLEYDEELEGSENELFGSESEYEQEDLIPDKRKPIKAVKAGPSTGDSLPPTNRHPATPTPQAPPRLTPEQRLEQIRQKHTCLDRPPSSGSPTLKWLTMRREFAVDGTMRVMVLTSVILMNSTRIDDIGGLTYKQMAVLLDQLPRTALQVVEENCPVRRRHSLLLVRTLDCR